MNTEGEICVDAIDDLCKIKKHYVDSLHSWYRTHATWPRVIFRITGTTVITLSLAIPFLASAKGNYLEVGVPIASFVIALLSALNAFYSWQKMWEKRISSQLAVEGLIAIWETEIAAARRETETEKGYERALKATQELIDKAKVLSVGETSSFFATLKFPEVSSARK